MKNERESLIEAARQVVTRAMDEGLSAVDVGHLFGEAVDSVLEERTAATARLLYGRDGS